ncbi:hypothetical protein L9F63_002566, partial [Diploptera punctata]
SLLNYKNLVVFDASFNVIGIFTNLHHETRPPFVNDIVLRSHVHHHLMTNPIIEEYFATWPKTNLFMMMRTLYYQQAMKSAYKFLGVQ